MKISSSESGCDKDTADVNLQVISGLLSQGYQPMPRYLTIPKMPTNPEKGEFILTITVNSFDPKQIKLPKQVLRVSYLCHTTELSQS